MNTVVDYNALLLETYKSVIFSGLALAVLLIVAIFFIIRMKHSKKFKEFVLNLLFEEEEEEEEI